LLPISTFCSYRSIPHIKNKQDSSPQADITLGKVTEAEIAANEKDTSKVVEHLKSAGKGMNLKPR